MSMETAFAISRTAQCAPRDIPNRAQALMQLVAVLTLNEHTDDPEPVPTSLIMGLKQVTRAMKRPSP